LLNRIPGKKVNHDLGVALDLINNSGKLVVDLTPITHSFIEHLDTFGRFRYLEISNVVSGRNLANLDRAAWELRRYCTLSDAPRQVILRKGVTPPKVRIAGGYLEHIVDDLKNPAREPLLWRNAFFGKRQRRRVRANDWMTATNSPLYLNPQILDEVLKYIYLPKDLIEGYRAHKKP
jgi:hypothetical protein